jgi:hypothetical protein
MPLRFQRRVRIAPGLSLNLNKRSISATVGHSGAHLTVGPKGTRSTIGIPGSGLSYTSYQRWQPGTAVIVAIVVIALLGLIFRLA